MLPDQLETMTARGMATTTETAVDTKETITLVSTMEVVKEVTDTAATMIAGLTVAMAVMAKDPEETEMGRTTLDTPTRLALMSAVLLLMQEVTQLMESTQLVKQPTESEEVSVMEEIRLPQEVSS